MFISQLSSNQKYITLSKPKLKDNLNDYIICTVVNDNYLDFLYYFTKSILEKCKNLSELIILYTGEKFSEDIIYKNKKIKILKHNETIKTESIWDNGWQKNVDLKSQLLKHLALNSDNPIFLIDVDSYFLYDFIDLVDFDKDILVTSRPQHHLPYIASFLGLIKPKRCIPFIDVWRNEMKKIQSVPRETRALVNTVFFFKENVKKIKIQEIEDTVISCVDYTSPKSNTRIIHFKGTQTIGDVKNLLNNRLERLKKTYNV